ncbi:MAG TPA: ABC transporter permease subunit [Chthoniobacterales bacterium]|nr:ABC transporter permease subunit [Chthoniobacterales bacterium]
MDYALSLFEFNAVCAVLARELRAALINRYFQIFAALSLCGGLATAIFSEDAKAVAFFVVQMALYLVSLFALLAGVSSAQGERSEWQLMFAQPVPRATYVFSKFIGYFLIIVAVLLLLFLPAAFVGSRVSTIAVLYFETLLLAAVFLSLGLLAGFLARDRAQALIIAVTAWLLMLVGFDLFGLLAARLEIVQRVPDLWLSVLMLNPLDAFRIDALFSLEQIPAEAASKTPLAEWWIAHTGLWFILIAALWSAACLAIASRFLNRFEE